MDNEEQQKQNFESRVETLTVLFNRFINNCRKLDGYSATVFTQPMCDMLLRAVGQLEDYERTKNIDDLLNDILNK